MDNYKIKVKDEAKSKEAQELFFKLGFHWKWSNKREFIRESISYLFTQEKDIYYGVSLTDFDKCAGKELTLPQLRDLVVLKRNDINDANWETEGGDQIYRDSSDKSYIYRSDGWDELQRHEMRQAMWGKPKAIIKSKDQGLISGAEALRALADGKEVEFEHDSHGWVNCLGLNIEQVIAGLFKLRLKPQTIKLELEIPKPFEPKHNDWYFFLDTSTDEGYSKCQFHNDADDKKYIQFGAWATEEEIKKVVEQLRKIRGAS